jgi:hypothetical protein
MKRAIVWLSLILTAQIALALGLQLAGDDPGTFEGGAKLLAFTPEQIDQLQIDSGDGSLELRKADGQWTLPGHFDAAADAQKIDSLLSTLLAIERSWPVAKTDEAIQRFKVADDGFERRLRFKAGDRELATLLLGNSPGFRKVHARLSGESQVLDIPFSTYQASIKAVDWVDRNVLQLKPEQISALELPDARLVRKEGEFELVGLSETEQTDREQARQLVDRLARLRIQDVVSRAEGSLPNPVALSLTLELSDGRKVHYDFAKGEEEGTALLKVADRPHVYKLSGTLLAELEKTTRSRLVTVKDASEQTPEEPQNGEAHSKSQAG